ncbi:MAG: LON peptidase substrate-binding domain-containing protein, partial [Alphaproteobacteria bacterium]|nr:LON peptidase substrate-binding domain-containing protein [Alphaproteobacteria bacterium]
MKNWGKKILQEIKKTAGHGQEITPAEQKNKHKIVQTDMQKPKDTTNEVAEPTGAGHGRMANHQQPVGGRVIEGQGMKEQGKKYDIKKEKTTEDKDRKETTMSNEYNDNADGITMGGGDDHDGGAPDHREQKLTPVLPLRNLVVFPSMVVPLFVGRERSIGALEEVMRSDREILLLTQKVEDMEDPKDDDLYDIGTLGNVLQLLRLPDGTVKVLVEGSKRVKVKKFHNTEHFLTAETVPLKEEIKNQEEIAPLMKTLVEQFQEFFQLGKQMPVELMSSVEKITDPSKLADTIAQNLSIKLSEKQELLAILSVDERLEKILGYLEGEISMGQVEKRIRNRVKRQMEKTQREYYLNEQMKAIQKELGSGGGEEGAPKNEIDELKQKAKKVKLSKEATEKFNAELKKLSLMGSMSSEATVVRNYLEWILALPWQNPSKLKTDLDEAEKILNEDHYGLDKVKERILEYLSVLQRVKKMKGPIL